MQTGQWTAVDCTVGSGVDSYFEYLVKGAILFRRPELMEMMNGRFSYKIMLGKPKSILSRD